MNEALQQFFKLFDLYWWFLIVGSCISAVILYALYNFLED